MGSSAGALGTPLFASSSFMCDFHIHDPKIAAVAPPSQPMFQAGKAWKGRDDKQNGYSLNKLSLFIRERNFSTGIYHHISLAKTVR